MVKVINQEYVPDYPISALIEHPRNPREGDDAAVQESIVFNDFFGAILVQKSTNHVIAGNTRLRVMRAEGAETIPVMVVDCDNDEALHILLADNRTSDKAIYNDPLVAQLLLEISENGDLRGTGYTSEELDILLQSMNQEDSFVGGVRQGIHAIDRLDEYNQLDIRSLILPYPGEEYERVAKAMLRLRDKLGYDSNAELVAALVDKEDVDMEYEEIGAE